MERPQIRIIEDQSEEIKPADISQNEAEMLLAKYGFSKPNENSEQTNNNVNDLSFEEMVRQEEQKRNQKFQEELHKIRGPKPITFGGKYDSDTLYGTDEDTGYTFKVNIVSDMPIPKKY